MLEGGLTVASSVAVKNHHSSPAALRLLLCLAAASLPSPISAAAADEQSGQKLTRTQVLEAARASKAAESAPRERSFLERKLYWYDNSYGSLLAGWKGFHIAGGDFPAGAGIKFGVGFDHAIGTSDSDLTLPNRVNVTARAAYSTRGYARLSAGIDLRNLGGAPVSVSVVSQHYEFPQEAF